MVGGTRFGRADAHAPAGGAFESHALEAECDPADLSLSFMVRYRTRLELGEYFRSSPDVKAASG